MKYTINGIKDFNTDHIFDCGQCFRWQRQGDGSYVGPAMGKAVRIKHFGETLEIDNCGEDDFNGIWKDYLDLDRDYGALKRELALESDAMKAATEYGFGIRILRQDFWETVVSFIISQNNNIPRIRGCIESLCQRYGEEAGEYGGKTYRAVPSPETLASLNEGDLADCRLGYREGYLIKTARQMTDRGGPGQVRKRLEASEDPIGELQEFCGIGPKVAACISLFGLNRLEAFPIDVWMRRVMNRLYGIEEKNVKAMKEYAADHFGQYGGIAQQYLFYYIRGLDRER